ncbi:MAG: HNH endonuclease, partial [Actinomycetota bacterium]|nr:HNH endonuclease [Actinomycetota bacterium]
MDVTAVCGRVRAVASVRADSCADRSALEQGLRSIGVVRSWLAAAEAELAARLAGLVSFPEKAVADAGRGSLGEAGRVLERSTTMGATPELAAGLDDGSVTTGHVDAVTKVARSLEGAQRDQLLARANRLAGFAAIESVVEFRRRLEREAKSLRADDGMDRFERQKSAARVRRWTDADGMWCLQGRFDPLTGVRMNARLTAEIEALFAESAPEGCPTDPVAKQEFL